MVAIIAVLALLVIAFLPKPVQVEIAPVVRDPGQRVISGRRSVGSFHAVFRTGPQTHCADWTTQRG